MSGKTTSDIWVELKKLQNSAKNLIPVKATSDVGGIVTDDIFLLETTINDDGSLTHRAITASGVNDGVPTWVGFSTASGGSGASGSSLRITGIVGEVTGTGNVLYLNNDGKYWNADADVPSTMTTELAVIADGATADSPDEEHTLVKIGVAQMNKSNLFTVGDKYYIDETAGISHITNDTSGFSSGSIIRYVGTAVTTNDLFFNPDQTYIEVP